MLSERRRHKKLQIVLFHLYEMSGKDKSIGTESSLVVAWWWRQEWKVTETG